MIMMIMLSMLIMLTLSPSLYRGAQVGDVIMTIFFPSCRSLSLFLIFAFVFVFVCSGLCFCFLHNRPQFSTGSSQMAKKGKKTTLLKIHISLDRKKTQKMTFLPFWFFQIMDKKVMGWEEYKVTPKGSTRADTI